MPLGTAAFFLALSPLSVEDANRRSQESVRRIQAISIERPTPSQIVGEVASGYAMEAGKPFAEAAMVGVDVLHMDCAAYPLAEMRGTDTSQASRPRAIAGPW